MSLGIPRADPQGQLAPVHCSLLMSLLPAYVVKDKLKEKGRKKNKSSNDPRSVLVLLSQPGKDWKQKVQEQLIQPRGKTKEKLPSFSSLPSCVWELLVKERVAHSTTAGNFLGSNLTLKGLTSRVRAPFPFPATCDTNTWFSQISFHQFLPIIAACTDRTSLLSVGLDPFIQSAISTSLSLLHEKCSTWKRLPRTGVCMAWVTTVHAIRNSSDTLDPTLVK